MGPEVEAVLGVDQLYGDPHLVARPPDAPFQHGLNAERVRDRPDVCIRALERERRGASRDPQVLDAGQRVQQFLGEPVAEILEIVVVAEVREREHGDRIVRAGSADPACGKPPGAQSDQDHPRQGGESDRPAA
ncbi:MAG: hypothetical protein P8049_11990, partial [Gemmatimonadota bacterium]